MNWTCPICQRKNTKTFVCECGFDESKNYEKYPILTKVIIRKQEILNKDNALECFIKLAEDRKIRKGKNLVQL